MNTTNIKTFIRYITMLVMKTDINQDMSTYILFNFMGLLLYIFSMSLSNFYIRLATKET